MLKKAVLYRLLTGFVEQNVKEILTLKAVKVRLYSCFMLTDDI